MNTSFAALAGTVLLTVCPLALATSSVDLAVTGAITPSACTPSISNDGVVDYGKISMQDLNPTGTTSLPTATFKLGVNCEAPSLFALYSLDNNHPSRSVYFVMGLIDPTNWIGNYGLQLANIVADVPNVLAIYSTDSGANWDAYTPGWKWGTHTLTAFGTASMGQVVPTLIKDVSLDLLVDPVIFPKYLIPAGETIALDGSATFELRYL